MKPIFVILSLVMALTCHAHSALTPQSRLAMKKINHQARVADNGSVSAFITIDDTNSLQQLAAAGVTINSITGNIVTASIPVRKMDEVATMGHVRSLQLAHKVELANDSARYYSNVNPVHEGTPLREPYTGNGVIVGMIDVGVDFNHINLCDSHGRSRVRRVYLPEDKTGHVPVIDGLELPGSHYTTPEEIAALTCDMESFSHGTHTTGTAAGSFKGNNMHGVAPEAELVICAMPDSMLTDVNIANSVKYIMNYAHEENKPVVINMSISSQEGAHDGTSKLCRLFDEVSGPGRICVLSSANSGSMNHVIDHTFKSLSDTIYSCVVSYNDHHGWIPGCVSIWSSSQQPHSLSLTAVSKSTGEILHSWPVPSVMKENETMLLSADTDEHFATYFKEGSIEVANGVEDDNGHYHTLAQFDLLPVDSDIITGIKVSSHPDDRVCMWGTNGLVFMRYGHEYMTSGSRTMSVSDIATGDSTISVGAYCTRNFMPLASGSLLPIVKASLHDIAYFSSYGPDVRGIARPDVVAPGYSLVSSSNRWDKVSGMATTWNAPGTIVDGVNYTYASQYGTSMSTPVVTGAIALWLQVNPSLGPKMIKKLLKETSLRDRYVTSGLAARWGSGKLDVGAGIDYLLSQSAINQSFIPTMSLLSNPCDGNFTIVGVSPGNATVNIHDLNGRMVEHTVANVQDNYLTLDMSARLNDGIYLLNVITASQHMTAKLIVKH